jgi:type II secretory pathway pseudopilin PulG
MRDQILHGGNFAGANVRSVDPHARGRRAIVWPAYLVAAVCFAVAVALSLVNLSLLEQLRTAQASAAREATRTSNVVRSLASERSMLEDLMDEDAQRFTITNGQVVLVRDRVYITLHDLAQPPRGKVYEAWTEPRNSTILVPASTFVPDAHGVAVVGLAPEAKDTGAVAVSVEPEGGSKTPTGKMLVLLRLN